MPHLRADSLEKYLLRRSTRSNLIRIEEHLLLCRSCRDRLDEFDAFMQAIKDASDASEAAGQEEPLTAGRV